METTQVMNEQNVVHPILKEYFPPQKKRIKHWFMLQHGLTLKKQSQMKKPGIKGLLHGSIYNECQNSQIHRQKVDEWLPGTGERKELRNQ